MPTDDDLRSAFHSVPGRDASTATWEAIQQRARNRRARARLVATGASVIAFVLASTALLIILRDEDDGRLVAGPSTSVTETASASTSATPTTTSATTAPVPADAPATFVGVTTDGALLRINRTTGEIVELARSGDPSDPGRSESGRSYIDGAISSPVGPHVYYSECCEPAVGSIYSLDPSGSAERMYDGSPAAISPDGRRLAVANGSSGISIHTVGSYESRWIAAAPASTESVASISFDPTGQRLVLGLTNHQGATALGVLDVGATSLSEVIRSDPPPAEEWASPALNQHGGLYFIASKSAGGRAKLRFATEPGGDSRVVDLGNRAPVVVSVDASGGWTLVAFSEGSVGVVGPEGTLREVVKTPSLVAVDW